MPWGYSLGENDFLPTPHEATRVLFRSEHRPPEDCHVIEPAAGHGAIVEVGLENGWERDRVIAVELRESERGKLSTLVDDVVIGDWFDFKRERLPREAIVTNPPFSCLPNYLIWALAREPIYCAFLMPIEEIAGVKRSLRWLPRFRPTGLVCISWRVFPKAVRGVAWFVWDRRRSPLPIEVF